MNKLSIMLSIMFLFMSCFAIENFVSVTQWRELNATNVYINEFMKCYIYNSTNLNYANYIDGTANITSGNELEGLYTIGCCDNCYFTDETLVLSSYSLNYDLGEINVTTPLALNYYVGDILDLLHAVDLSETTTSAYFNFENYIYFTPLIFIIGLGMFLFILLENIAGFIIGAVLGAVIGIAFLIGVNAISPLIALLIGVLVIIGGILCIKMS